ncbi:glucosaminidase domain-containing protein [Selenomonas ruminis]|uniref:Tetratricopeptide repeat protein n=1 Tax=Selenomonas ruminis TaxID=2593411 RepID=A0A5D6VV91_9FIRM|nr:glucosaminidase domain-containing protein [Selenomonas sp. mPRGC5]TYZ19951.1 tetratricopeptide repeat protein [Selenomonas sp. mPRGC5]
MRFRRSLLAASLSCSLLAVSFQPSVTEAASASPQVASTPVANRTLPDRPDFSKEMPGDVNKKAISQVHWKIAPAFNSPMMTVDAAPDTISIMGPAEATQEQMISFIKKHNAKPKLTCSVEDIVNYYYQEAGREGIRPDVALCQAIKETGFFGYGGDVSPKQNNFCGLGATGNHEPGHSFATAQLGVRAHIQHLLAYTRVEKPSIAIVDPRYWHVVRNRPDLHGKVLKWTGLNGAWAVPGKNYGQEILSLWRQAQAPDASDAALDAGNRKVKSAPDEASSYIYRGIVWYNRGDYTAALKDFSQAMVFEPQSGEALYNHALTAGKLGNKKLARKDYDTLLTITPNLNQGWFNRGLMRFEAKDYTGAIADMEQLLQIEDRSADARNLIGVAHIQQKKYSNAWKDFYEAAAINSANMNVLANQFIMEACLKK